MKKAFVTGWPISHSKSPALHRFWLNEYELEGSYEAVPVRESEFPSFLRDLIDNGYLGGNITIPHKETAYEQIPLKDTAAEKIGAVNTVWIEEGVLRAGNTDAYGFAANLDDFAPEWREGRKAVVLGAGGASRAIIYALQAAEFETISIVNRTVMRAKKLARQFGGGCDAHGLDDLDKLLSGTDMLINTTSLGMVGGETAALPDLSGLPPKSLVTDIVYTPLMTPLLKSAAAREHKVVDGLGMLLHQAVPGFEKWFGVRAEVSTKLRDHMLRLL